MGRVNVNSGVFGFLNHMLVLGGGVQKRACPGINVWMASIFMVFIEECLSHSTCAVFFVAGLQMPLANPGLEKALRGPSPDIRSTNGHFSFNRCRGFRSPKHTPSRLSRSPMVPSPVPFCSIKKTSNIHNQHYNRYHIS